MELGYCNPDPSNGSGENRENNKSFKRSYFEMSLLETKLETIIYGTGTIPCN